MRTRGIFITVIILLTVAMSAAAQKQRKAAEVPSEISRAIEEPMIVTDKIGVDTLELKDRISIHTNSVDWLMQIPNVGVEFDIKNTNWNRHTIGLNFRYKWAESHTYKPGFVFTVGEVRLDYRNYFRVKQVDKNEWTRARHRHLWDKPLSARHKRSKHPNAMFYRGLYLSYTRYSFLLGTAGRQGTGFQGTSIGAGYQFGMVKPLYVFRNGHSLDLDLGAALGFICTSHDKYRLDRESNCYDKTFSVGNRIFPMVNELRCALVYRLGKTPATKKYKWRYDVDVDYQYLKDSVHLANENHRTEVRRTDSIQSLIRKEFWAVYDSLMVIENAKADSMRVKRLREEKANAEAELKKLEKRPAAAAAPAVTTEPEGEATTPQEDETTPPAEGTPPDTEATTEGDTPPPAAEEASPAAQETEPQQQQQQETPAAQQSNGTEPEQKDNERRNEESANGETGNNAPAEEGKEDGQ